MTYLTARGAATKLGVAHPTITRAIAKGKIKATKLGNTWFIDPRDLASYQVPAPRMPYTKPEVKRSRTTTLEERVARLEERIGSEKRYTVAELRVQYAEWFNGPSRAFFLNWLDEQE